MIQRIERGTAWLPGIAIALTAAINQANAMPAALLRRHRLCPVMQVAEEQVCGSRGSRRSLPPGNFLPPPK